MNPYVSIKYLVEPYGIVPNTGIGKYCFLNQVKKSGNIRL